MRQNFEEALLSFKPGFNPTGLSEIGKSLSRLGFGEKKNGAARAAP
jgi:hypothetical protein